MKDITSIMLCSCLILSAGSCIIFKLASAQDNSTTSDMSALTRNIGNSLAKLTGSNSSDLLKNTMASINKTASQVANESHSVINEGSLNMAEIVAKKIAIGMADVLSNISGEIKQGIENK